ncbi:MAG: calcium/sodium antiporter [Candidatus Aminicenantes bacterium]|jgi:cation:H+ antiporter
MIIVYFVVLIITFALLFKCADFFIQGASAIAEILNIPKMVVGIVLVGLATTAPEFGVSVMASFLGKPEFALGNAIGSVICDDGIALAFAAILAPIPILVNCRMLKIIGPFLLAIDFIAFGLARDGGISRIDGLILLILLAVYFLLIFKVPHFRSIKPENKNRDAYPKKKHEIFEKKLELKKPVSLFGLGLIGVVLATRGVIWSAENIAIHFSISEIVIGATVLAIGTSLPEISTCIVAALKGEGEIAVGDIIGADILNILWIIGVASVVRPIRVEVDIINFTFPFMILIVLIMLVSMRIGCRLTKLKGIILFATYLVYLFFTLKFFT